MGDKELEPKFVMLRESGMTLNLSHGSDELDSSSPVALRKETGKRESLQPSRKSQGRRRSWSFSKKDTELLRSIRKSVSELPPKAPGQLTRRSSLVDPKGRFNSPEVVSTRRVGRSLLHSDAQEDACRYFFEPSSRYGSNELSAKSEVESTFLLTVGKFSGRQLPAPGGWGGRPEYYLELTVESPDGKTLFTQRSSTVRRTTEPTWPLWIEGISLQHCKGTGWLKGGALRVSCYGKSNQFVGAFKIDLFTLATGAPQYELPLLDAKGQPYLRGTRARMQFTANLLQVGRCSVTIHNLQCFGIRPASAGPESGEQTNPRAVVRLIFPDGTDDAASRSTSSKQNTTNGEPFLSSSVCYDTLHPGWQQLYGGALSSRNCTLEEMLQMKVEIALFHTHSYYSTSEDEYLGSAEIPIAEYFHVGKESFSFQASIQFQGAAYGSVFGEFHYDLQEVPQLAPMLRGTMNEEGLHDAQLLHSSSPLPHVANVNQTAPPAFQGGQPNASAEQMGNMREVAALKRQQQLLLTLCEAVPMQILKSIGNFPSSSKRGPLQLIASYNAQEGVRFLIRLLDYTKEHKIDSLLDKALDTLRQALINHRDAQRAFLNYSTIPVLNELISSLQRQSGRLQKSKSSRKKKSKSDSASCIPPVRKSLSDVLETIAILALHDSQSQKDIGNGGVMLALKDLLVVNNLPKDVKIAALRCLKNLCYGLGGMPAPRWDDGTRGSSGASAGGITQHGHNSDLLRYAHGIRPLVDCIVAAKEADVRDAAVDALKIVMENKENQRTALPMLGELLTREDAPQIQVMAMRMMRDFIGIQDAFEASRALLEAVGIGPVVHLLTSSDRGLCQNAVYLLKENVIKNATSAGRLRQTLLSEGKDGIEATYLRLLAPDVVKDRPDATSIALHLLKVGVQSDTVQDSKIATYIEESVGAVDNLLRLAGHETNVQLQIVAVKLLARIAVLAQSPAKNIKTVPLAVAYTPLKQNPPKNLALGNIRLCFSLAKRFQGKKREVTSDKAMAAFTAAIVEALQNRQYTIAYEALRFLSMTMIAQASIQAAFAEKALAAKEGDFLGTLISFVLQAYQRLDVDGAAVSPLVPDASTTPSPPPVPISPAHLSNRRSDRGGSGIKLSTSKEASVDEADERAENTAMRSVMLMILKVIGQVKASRHAAVQKLFKEKPAVKNVMEILEKKLQEIVTTTASMRVRLEVGCLLRQFGYTSTELCHYKLQSRPQNQTYYYCRTCLHNVCPTCRDRCHSVCTIGKEMPNFGGDCVCGKSLPNCRVRHMEKVEEADDNTTTAASSTTASSTPSSTNSVDDPANAECVICMDHAKEVLLYNCGHLALCQDCANALQRAGQPCPLCSKPIADIIKVYRS